MVHAIGKLRAYTFVTSRDDGSSYDIHRRVHLATKVWLREHGATKELNDKVASHFAQIFPADDHENRALWREYFPHALQFRRNTKTLDSGKRYDLCMAVVGCLQVERRVGEAVVWLSECFLWRQGHFVEDHPSRPASKHALSDCFAQQYSDAEDLQESDR